MDGELLKAVKFEPAEEDEFLNTLAKDLGMNVNDLKASFEDLSYNFTNLLQSLDDVPASKLEDISALIADSKRIDENLISNLQKISPKLAYSLNNIKSREKLANVYVKENFNIPILNSTIGKPQSILDLLKAAVKLKNDKAVPAIISAMTASKAYVSLGLALSNSDIVIRHVFVKAIIPSLLSSAMSKEDIRIFVQHIRKYFSKTHTHREFFKVIQSLQYLLFLFGVFDSTVLDEFMGCLL